MFTFNKNKKVRFHEKKHQPLYDCNRMYQLWVSNYNCDTKRWSDAIRLEKKILLTKDSVLLNNWELADNCLAIYKEYPISRNNLIPRPVLDNFDSEKCCEDVIDPTKYYVINWYRKNEKGDYYFYKKIFRQGIDVPYFGCQNNTGQYIKWLEGWNCLYKVSESSEKK